MSRAFKTSSSAKRAAMLLAPFVGVDWPDLCEQIKDMTFEEFDAWNEQRKKDRPRKADEPSTDNRRVVDDYQPTPGHDGLPR